MAREDGAARRVLVVGCGMAGARFVGRLTALDPDIRITVLDGAHHPAYNRTLLTGVLAGRHRPASFHHPGTPLVSQEDGPQFDAAPAAPDPRDPASGPGPDRRAESRRAAAG